ncbi:MAG TPA: 6-carboxytetrahydropterin synthase [Gemmatimonadales bacterium]|jgi:6-pyruvoyltetrahydropterin/6-carboxytetrahydropterin synthase
MTATFLVSAEAAFAAAHTLPGVDMCARMHGHNWRVRVTVQIAPERLDAHGMGVDFRDLERYARAAVGEFEHRYLNELPAFQDRAPTAETIARVVAERVAAALAGHPSGATLTEVELWEMAQYKVSYRP